MLPSCLTKCCFTFINMLETPPERAVILVIKWTFIPILDSVALLWYKFGLNKIVPSLILGVLITSSYSLTQLYIHFGISLAVVLLSIQCGDTVVLIWTYFLYAWLIKHKHNWIETRLIRTVLWVEPHAMNGADYVITDPWTDETVHINVFVLVYIYIYIYIYI